MPLWLWGLAAAISGLAFFAAAWDAPGTAVKRTGDRKGWTAGFDD